MSSYSQKQINRLCNKSVRLQQDIKLSFEEIEKLDKLFEVFQNYVNPCFFAEILNRKDLKCLEIKKYLSYLKNGDVLPFKILDVNI